MVFNTTIVVIYDTGKFIKHKKILDIRGILGYIYIGADDWRRIKCI